MQVDIIKSLSAPTILIVAGLLFLLIGIVGEIIGKIKAETRLQRMILSALGVILIIVGVVMSLRSVPPYPVNGPPQPTPTVSPTAPPATSIPMPTVNPNARVWVNRGSHIYHCFGSHRYGNTKQGEYMAQKEAWERGNRPADNKGCP
jgi:hypothetical protein